MEQHCKLSDVDLTGVSNVPYRKCSISARVIEVIDGDTVKLLILVGDHPLRLNIRLSGIDTPEMRPKPVVHSEEADVAKLVKAYVSTLLARDQIVSIRLLNVDKYGGRYVGDIYITKPGSKDAITLSDHLVAAGYAKVYNGKKKEAWSREHLLMMRENLLSIKK